MGLLGQLSSIFKGKAAVPEIAVASVRIDHLPKWFKQKADPVVEQIREDLKRTFGLIQQEVKAGLKTCDTLEHAQLQNENIPEKAKVIMHGNRRSYLHLTRMFFENLAMPAEINYQNALAFVEQFEDRLNTYTKSSQKNYLVLQEFFREESNAVAKHARRVDELVRTLLDNQYKDIIAASDLIYRLCTLQKQQEDLKKEWDEAQETMKIVHAQIEKNRIEVEKQKDSFEYARMKDIRQEKENLEQQLRKQRDDISLVFSPLQPGLKKFARMAAEYEQLIMQYIEDVPAALKADTHLVILQILQKMAQAIAQNQIDLKDKKREKALEKAREITAEYLRQYLGTVAMLESSLAQLDKQLKANPVIQAIEEYSYRNEHLKQSMMKFEEESARLEKALEKGRHDELCQQINDAVRKLFNIEVKLREPAEADD